MTHMRRPIAPVAALSLAIAVSGCATVPGTDRLAEKDPLEKFNRKVWGVNMAADKVLIKPASNVYRAVAPKQARRGVSNLFGNLTEPWSFVNNVLQGKPDRATRNFVRFLVNSTFGLGGLFDVAGKKGVQPAPEDLGQTLARWGFNGGPYLVLPLLGPSTLRDGIGSGAAFYADPINIGIREADVSTPARWGYRVAQVIDARSQLTEAGADAFLKSSLDPYAAARSAYLQRRRAAILDQEDSMDAGPPDDDQPVGDAVPTPAGDAATAPASAATTPASAPSVPAAPPPADGQPGPATQPAP